MIPKAMKRQWILDSEKRELHWTANHGGGIPDFLNRPRMTEEGRLAVLEEIGMTVQDRFSVADAVPLDGTGFLSAKNTEYAELAGGIYVCLTTGWVTDRDPRRREDGWRKIGAAYTL